MTLAEWPVTGFGGATWGTNDTIVYSIPREGLWRVSALGGQPERLTNIEEGEFVHVSPEYLPDAESLLFEIVSADRASQITLLSLTTDGRRSLLPGNRPSYVSTGHLVFARGGSLWRTAFDAGSLDVVGEPFPVLEGVQTSNNGTPIYTVSDSGSVAYAPGVATSSPQRTLVWTDRQGNEEVLSAPPRAYLYPRISPDGASVAIEVFVSVDDADIWVWDFARETLTRLTVDPASDEYPVWTPDGQRVIFTTRRDGGVPNPYWVAADGSGDVERLAEHPIPLYPHTVSPDGTRLVLREGVQPPTQNLLMLTLDAEQRIEPLLAAETFAERNAEISPDGRWIAYESTESGEVEIYVRPFPDVNTGRTQVSSGGGRWAVWARSGDELFYRDDDGQLIAVQVELGETFRAGTATVVVPRSSYTPPGTGVLFGRTYDVSPDGQRFLLVRDVTETGSSGGAIVIVRNWFDELNRLAPGN